ncbi:helix-turn-helix domain-containing protein [Streptococcus moroccensis]|uniref:DNA-binding Xre family transcriptional regulator n=1 Tax=Streptococcus moroccensis TaxID=1451356 RepID=A0ABT9YRL9_9STRE|nr:helix-turn-helix transcriptional regulator [Streptococcus moroccensis]MDQ0222364.1 DNA-binding Xre family transcriptional regulator [Streptococcus moroccensis]
MAICYNKLWNLVRQNKMKKGELAKAAGISDYMMSKLNKDEPVQMEIMIRLCKVFHCDIGDLMEVIEEE